MTIKALTVLQPWAAMILDGLKTVENRTWRTNYRGRLLIHSGVSRSRFRGEPIPGAPPADGLVFGALLGSVDLINCLPLAEVSGETWAEGPWCWVLRNPILLPQPLPCRGALSLWTPPAGVLPPARNT